MKLTFFLVALLSFSCQTTPIQSSAPGWSRGPGEQWSLNNGKGLVLSVNPGKGGRITSLVHQGLEILKPGDGIVDGSTLWSAPQKAWESENHWPPAKAWDELPYEPGLSSDKLTLTLKGQVDPLSGLSFTKSISLFDTKININYEITNQGKEPRDSAPWEVTRVLPGGVAFFPVVDNGQWKGTSRLKPTAEENGILWYRKGNDGNRKLFRDSQEAWVAYAIQGRILVKELETDVKFSQFAPGEAEAEIYSGKDYVELESQGSMETLTPGQTQKWTVLWSVFSAPEIDMEKLPNSELLKRVRDGLKSID